MMAQPIRQNYNIVFVFVEDFVEDKDLKLAISVVQSVGSEPKFYLDFLLFPLFPLRSFFHPDFTFAKRGI